VLSPEAQAEILTLHYNEGLSAREISRRLRLNRRSVKRVLRRRSVNLSRQVSQKKSILDPYKSEIISILERDPRCSGTAILNRIRGLGYLGGRSTMQYFISAQKLRPERKKEAFLRLDFSPAEVAQVDWGEFGNVFGDGVKIHCFAIVLCYSRYMYVEFTRSEKFEDFIRCHENAFRYFGGAPRQCWYDNLTSAVTDRMGSLVRFNARFMAYMGHHGIRPHACNVARGNEKGRVEDLIKFIRMNFWPGRTFTDFDDLNSQLIDWRNRIANQREHRSTKRVVRLVFEAEEQKLLMSMNPSPYDTDEVISRVIPSDFHFVYETNRYSVPWTLVGMSLTIRSNPREIKVYYNDQLVATHERSYLKNRVFTNKAHQQGLLERKPGAQSRESWQVAAVKRIGPKMSEYMDILRSGHRSMRNELGRILCLSTVYGNEAVHAACEELLGRGIIGVEALELTLKRSHHPSEQNPKPIQFENDKLNRIVPEVDLRRYDALLFEGDMNSSASDRNKNGDITTPHGDQGPA